MTGATGLVGGALVARLLERGTAVRAVSRSARAAADERVERVVWDGVEVPADALAGCDAVVHLAGEPIFGGLPTQGRLERMRASRVDSTRAIARTLGELGASERPRTLVNASAVGFYGSRGDERLGEASAPGRGLLAELCRDWEAAADEARAHAVRVARMRLGIVFAREGGALATMRRPFAWNVGGRLGNGRQWVPWVHLDDAVGALLLALEGRLEGAVNVVAPEPVTNRELTAALAERLAASPLLARLQSDLVRVPGFAIRAVFGEIADELLGSKRVVPGALERARYRYRFASLGDALDDCLA
ncbi:MAG: TIGR01777 family oxidoreductase [Myxococcota bacterium]